MRVLQAGLSILLAMVVLAGCGSGYVLRGKVMPGTHGMTQFVDATDEQLVGEGVAEARVSVYRDPDSLGRELVAKGVSNPRGELEIEIDAFGTGWMVEQWLIEINAAGYETVMATVKLPSVKDNKWILVTMTPGPSLPGQRREDLWEEYQKYK